LEIIEKYFPNLNNQQKKQFSKLDYLYKSWNQKINVVSRKDIDLLYQRHVLHSMAIAKIINFRGNTTVLDVGTGGGFPGIPLAILFPSTKFYLIDSIGKKITVVNAIISELGLKNAKAEQKHSNELKPSKFFEEEFFETKSVVYLPRKH